MHPSFGSMVVMTRDVSDGGVFLLMKEADRLPVGTVLEIQSLAFGESAPVLKAKVVRVSADGIGLVFTLDESAGMG